MKLNKEKIFNIFVILIFVLVSVMLGLHHEAWADEAQSWLLARDASIYQLLTNYLHYEGHPILWYLILKFFLFIKFPYEKIYLISVLFSTIGVSLFVCKSKFNKLIKVLFTFSFFIIYQYNIVCRCYCLVLPILSLIAILWKDRHKHIFLFTLLLIVLLSLEVSTFLIAGSIFVYLLYDFYKNKYDNKKEHIISYVILFLFFLITTIYCFPKTSVSNGTRTFFLSYSFFYPITVGNDLSDKIELLLTIGGYITSLILIVYFYLIYKNDKFNLWQFIMFIGLPCLFSMIVYFQGWHLGIILITAIFCFWIHDYHDNKLVKRLLIFSFICQIPWTIYTVYNDIKYTYYGSIEPAKFIKKYDYKNLKIYGYSFFSVGVNAYFDENIFYNFSDDVGFYVFDRNGKYFKDYYEVTERYFDKNDKDFKNRVNYFLANFYRFDTQFYLDNDVDIIVFYYIDEMKKYDFSNYQEPEEKLLEYYNKYTFDNKAVFELGIFDNRYSILYVRKDIDNV